MTEDNPVVRFRETSVLSSSPQLQGRLAHAGQPRSLRRMLVRNLGSWRFVATGTLPHFGDYFRMAGKSARNSESRELL